MTRPKPTLKKILDDLLEQAKANPGIGKPFNLSGGLCLHMLVDADHHLTLGISRFQSFPSEEEWETVLRDAGLPTITHRTSRKQDRIYFVAEFDMPVQEELPL